MKCMICNIVIEDDGITPYCDEIEIHGGYACADCCTTVTKETP